MRSLAVVVVHELFKPFECAHPTADLGEVETVDAHFDRLKPLSMRFRSV